MKNDADVIYSKVVRKLNGGYNTLYHSVIDQLRGTGEDRSWVVNLPSSMWPLLRPRGMSVLVRQRLKSVYEE